MRAALARAGMQPSDVDYINAHGTSTMADTIELAAVERMMGDAAAGATMSSTKSAIGHLLGAAGAVEAIFCILAMRDQVAPPTLNLDDPAVEPTLSLAPHRAEKRRIDVALSNSFGFGGTNASLVFRSHVAPAIDAKAWLPFLQTVLEALQPAAPTLVLWGKIAE